jgi:ATP-dependent helicase/nuclease subunit A
VTREQRAAIEARDRDVLLEAGAGTGKTTVLVGRYCDAVTEDGVGLDEILAFTFTDRAAAQLQRRVRLELQARGATQEARQTGSAWISTIHGFCRRLIAAHPAELGLDSDHRVLDELEADRVSTRAFDGALERFLDGDEPERTDLLAAYRLPRLRRLIRGAHDELRSRGVAAPELPPAPSGGEEGRAAYEGIRELLRLYTERYAGLKGERSGLDFEDLQLEALRLLRETAVGESRRGRFRHILVDEFQDTNRLQMALIEALRGENTKVFAVGDEHQSIYGFRHADLEVFRAERERLATLPDSEGQVLALRGNFRSVTGVLGGVNWVGGALLDGFEPLTPGDPEAAQATSGDRTEVLLPRDRGDEARLLAERLRRLHDEDGVALGDIVVLLRSMTHVTAFEQALERAGLRPRVVGNRGYWTQQHVEDTRCFLGAIANPQDDPSLFGALSSPACGVLPDTLWLLRQLSKEKSPIWSALERVVSVPRPDSVGAMDGDSPGGGCSPLAIPEDEISKLSHFHGTLTRLRAEAPVLPLEDLVERTGGDRTLMRLARDYEETEGRDLQGFLDFLATRTERDAPPQDEAAEIEIHDGVRVMTVHAAKGLEFPVVAVADLGRRLTVRPPEILIGRRPEHEGLVGVQLARIAAKGERLFDYEALKDAMAQDEVAEECRLAYVAASRARDRLILSGCLSEGWERSSSPGRPIIQRLMEADAPRDFLSPAAKDLAPSLTS